MPKLIYVKLPHLHPLQDLGGFYVDAPPALFEGWHLAVRGPVVWVISPPGFRPGIPVARWNPEGPRLAFARSRDQVAMTFAIDDTAEIDKLASYTSEPFARVPRPADE